MTADIRTHLTGVWDTDQSPLTLGGLLVFVCELQARAKEAGMAHIRICIVGREDLLPAAAAWVRLERGVFPGFLLDLEGLEGVFVLRETSDLNDFLRPGDLRWPPAGIAKSFGSTMILQSHFRRFGSIPRLACRADVLRTAWGHLNRDTIPVAVHAKSVQGQGPEESNATWDTWRALFDRWGSRRVTFYLLGPDGKNISLPGIPHVRSTQEMGFSLSEELALIQLAPLFLGMSSGPCNMALLGETPFLIFKHPKHDVQAMNEELSCDGTFPFLLPGQRFLRQAETVEALEEACEEALSPISLDTWRSRWQSLAQVP